MVPVTTALEVAILCLTAFSSFSLLMLICVDAVTERKTLGRALQRSAAARKSGDVVAMPARRAERAAGFGSIPESQAA